jgi:hypothetical protein
VLDSKRSVIQGIKFCSKIQSVQNLSKSNESVCLIVTNPTQLVWVQTDVRSERYRVLFKMTNRQKKEVLTVQSVRTLTWQVIRHVVGSYLDSWHVTWHVCSERDDDTWPSQWSPRVIYLFV